MLPGQWELRNIRVGVREAEIPPQSSTLLRTVASLTPIRTTGRLLAPPSELGKNQFIPLFYDI